MAHQAQDDSSGSITADQAWEDGRDFLAGAQPGPGWMKPGEAQAADSEHKPQAEIWPPNYLHSWE